MQKQIEKKADKFIAASSPANQRKRRRRQGKNAFFPLAGDKLTSAEIKLMEKLGDEDESTPLPGLQFCLPCDVRDDVYAKPPTYRHTHSLRYDPKSRPQRIPPEGTDLCHCVGSCGDDDCFNRVLYTECYGDLSMDGKSNCNVGANCGNRQIAKRKYAKCKPKREQGKGWGLVTLEKVEKGKLVLEYVGEVINDDIKDERLKKWSEEHPNDPNFYIMALAKGWFIDAREVANLSRFINHSCGPNCELVPVNVGGYMRNAIVALRDIAPNEFLSYDYHFETKQEDKFVCRCGASTCRGTMKGYNSRNAGGDTTTPKGASEIWEDAKSKLDKDKVLIRDYFEREQSLRTAQETLPGSENTDELVAHGPQRRDRSRAVTNRIFLWRNALQGASFENRIDRLEKR
jgi:hypothetical protein